MSETTIIILHGWGHSRESWAPFARMFQNVHVEAIDLPGFGSEPLVSPDWGIPEYAQWVVEKLKAISTKRKITLIGHSFGGRIAAYIASQDPVWLDRLVLIGAPCLYIPSQKVRILKRIAKVAKLIGLDGKSLSLNSELTDADKKGLGEIYRRVVSYDQAEELQKIKVRTLILRGSEDTYPDDSICAQMHRLCPQSEYTIVPDIGHNIHLESPTLLYGKVQKFIESTH
ncbi:MAG: alpha/beta hydrolase [Candidatus Roizmanbacteria bacterium]